MHKIKGGNAQAMRIKRRLSAIMAVSTAVTVELTDMREKTRAGIRASHETLLSYQIGKHSGNVIGESAETVLLEFTSAVLAIDCAVEMQRVVAFRNFKLPPENRVYFQIAVHVGEIAEDDNVVSGEGIKLVAYLVNTADLGGIVLSGSAYDQTTTQRGNFEESKSFLNSDFSASVRIYAMAGAGEATDAVWTICPNLTLVGLTEPDDPSDPSDDPGDPSIEDMTIFEPSLVNPSSGPQGAQIGTPSSDHNSITVTMVQDQGPPDTSLEPEQKILRAIEKDEDAAEALAARGLPYKAMETYDRAISAAMPLAGLEERIQHLQELRNAIESMLAFTGDAVLDAPSGPVFISIGANLEIGRSAEKNPHDIAVGCQLVSRIGKQARITYAHGSFWVMDHGSTNGSFLNDRFLETQLPVALDFGGKAAEISFGGGREPPRSGPCRLRLRLIGGEHAALVMNFHTEGLTASELTGLEEQWPSMHEDCRNTWIFASGPVFMGKGGDCAIDVETEASGPLARIEYDKGYTLGPHAKASIYVDQVLVSRPVTLGDGVEIRVGNSQLRFEMRKS